MREFEKRFFSGDDVVEFCADTQRADHDQINPTGDPVSPVPYAKLPNNFPAFPPKSIFNRVVKRFSTASLVRSSLVNRIDELLDDIHFVRFCEDYEGHCTLLLRH